MTREYREAAVEALDILKHTEPSQLQLIPRSFITYLQQNAASDYIANIDYSKPINEMNIKLETKGIIATICYNWWWSKEEKQEYNKLVNESKIKYQKELNEKYNPDNIFKKETKSYNDNSIQELNHSEQGSITVYKKQNWFHKVLDNIKKFLS